VGTPQAISVFPSGKYLTFRIARQDFAMDASRVRAILPAQELSLLSRSIADTRPLLGAFGEAAWLEKWTCGFAALQGRAFPVIDLRAKLGIAYGSPGRQPCIVVVEVATRLGPQLAGFVADRISEIVQARERDFSRGKLRAAGRPRQVLDPDILLSE
jgi:chemotaxis signal transduction protein